MFRQPRPLHPLSIGLLIAHLLVMFLLALPWLARGFDSWWLDNFSNLQLQWSLLALLLLLVGWRQPRRLNVGLALVYLALVLVNFAPLWWVKSPPQQPSISISIAQLNLQYFNPDIDRVIDSLVDSDYDLIALQEIADFNLDRVRRLQASYPYVIGSRNAQGPSSGHAVFSRLPLVKRDIVDLGYVEGRVIETAFEVPGLNAPVELLALHPGAPRSEELWQLRNRTLAFIAERAAISDQAHRIVVGDINVSPWSPHHARLLDSGGLVNTATGQGYIPSWSLLGPQPIVRLLTSVYIDHCLVSPDIGVVGKSYRLVPGSDHLLVETRLALPQ